MRTWLSAWIVIAVWAASAPSLVHRGLDAGFYFEAAARVARGESPYVEGGGYIYPPPLAAALSLLPCSPEQLNLGWNALLMLSAVVAIALGMRAAGFRSTAWSGLAYLLLFSQPVRWGLQLGNASLLLAGLLALAAALLPRRPALAGVVIGIAALVKVIPAIFLGWLAALHFRQARLRALASDSGPAFDDAREGPEPRLLRGPEVRSPWLTATMAAGLAVLLGALSGDNAGYLHAKAAEVQSRVALGANFSILSVIERAFGLSLPGALAPLLGAAAAVGVGLRTPAGRRALLASWGIVQLIAIVSTPVAWSHLFVLAYWPALVAAGQLFRVTQLATTRERQLDALLFALAVLILARTALWFSPDHFTGRVILPLAPLFALFVLGAFLLRELREPTPAWPPHKELPGSHG